MEKTIWFTSDPFWNIRSLGAPVQSHQQEYHFLESKNKYVLSLLNGKHTIFHRLKVNKFHFLYLSGTVLWLWYFKKLVFGQR